MYEIANAAESTLTIRIDLMLTSCLLLVSACSNNPQPSDEKILEKIVVSHASTWGGGKEVEVNKKDERGNVLELNRDLDAPIGSGKRAVFTVTSSQFEKIQSALSPLEEKAIDSKDISKIDFAEYDASLGFDCKNRITDLSFVRAIWIYSDQSKSWASYYTGCDNEFSKTITKFLTEEFDGIESAIPDTNWIESKSTMDDLLE